MRTQANLKMPQVGVNEGDAAIHLAAMVQIGNYVRANLGPLGSGRSSIVANGEDRVISPYMLGCRLRGFAEETKSTICVGDGLVRIAPLSRRAAQIARFEGGTLVVHLDSCWEALSTACLGYAGLGLPVTTDKILLEFANALPLRPDRHRPVEVSAGAYGVGNSMTN